MRGACALALFALLGCGDRPLTVEIDRALYQGDVTVPPGRYRVAVDEAAQQVELASDAGVHRLSAKVRKRVFAVRKPEVELRKVPNEPRRLLLVRLPPDREWVAPLWETPPSP